MSDTERVWYRNYSVHYRDDPAVIMAAEKLISVLESHENLSRYQAIGRIFRAGIEVLSDDPSFGAIDLQESAEMMRLYNIAEAKAARYKCFRAIYQELGPERMTKVLGEASVEMGLEEFLDEFRIPVLSPFRQMKVWIARHLSDGEVHALDEMREAAIQDGIIADPDIDAERARKDYIAFKTAGSEMGVSGGGRGKWRQRLVN